MGPWENNVGIWYVVGFGFLFGVDFMLGFICLLAFGLGWVFSFSSEAFDVRPWGLKTSIYIMCHLFTLLS